MASILDFSILQLTEAAVALLVVGYVVKLIRNFYYARTRVANLVGPSNTTFIFHRTDSCLQPKPPHSFLLGSLPIMSETFSKFPARVHPHTVIPLLRKKYNLPPIFYVDTWPFGDPLCVVLDPDVASQVTVQPNMPKHRALEEIVLPLTGRNSLLTIEGKHHKQWRNVFNPGFSNNHLMTLIDGVVEDSLVFLDILGKYADSGEMFSMEEAAMRFTVDVIGRVVLYGSLSAYNITLEANTF